MGESLAVVKQELRQRMLEKLRGISSAARVEAETVLLERISGHSAFRRAQIVMMYMALPAEISLNTCIQTALKAGKVVSLPRVVGREIKPFRIGNLEGDLAAGAYNVLEPGEHCAPVEVEDLELVFVPGLAFDRLGWRLGRGKGFYDRFLNMLPETCHTIGVCFTFQLLKSIPSGPNDVCVKEVIAV